MKTIHLVTQRNQPYGSRRKCCEQCGLAIFAMKDGDGYITEKFKFTKENAHKNGYRLCIAESVTVS